MNVVIVFAELAIIVFVMSLISSIAYHLYPKILGKAGEGHVKKELKKLNSDYIVLNDIMIKTRDNNSHQIDHIIVSKYGIFVIETKQYNGYIKGNANDKKWIMNKKSINNPLYQNYGHIKALSELLNMDTNDFINIVCFSGNVKVKVKSNNLVGIVQLIDKIKSYKDVIYNDISYIVDIINENNITDKDTLKNHINTIRSYDDNKCPKCGSILVERNSKYGKFIGCSNYPKCKYTRNMK